MSVQKGNVYFVWMKFFVMPFCLMTKMNKQQDSIKKKSETDVNDNTEYFIHPLGKSFLDSC